MRRSRCARPPSTARVPWDWRSASVRSRSGKQADLAAVRLDALESQPLYDVISQLVYATGRHQVSDVWIAGRRKLADRELVGHGRARPAASASRAGATRIAAI